MAVVMVVPIRLGWALCVDHDGQPMLVGPGHMHAPLFSISEQPKTCRLLLRLVERWMVTAEAHYLIDDPVLLAVRWTSHRLVEYLAEFDGVPARYNPLAFIEERTR